jgi:hypothetical protein
LFPDSWTPYVVGVETLAGAYGVFRLRNTNRQAVYGGANLPPREDGPTL